MELSIETRVGSTLQIFPSRIAILKITLSFGRALRHSRHFYIFEQYPRPGPPAYHQEFSLRSINREDGIKETKQQQEGQVP